VLGATTKGCHPGRRQPIRDPMPQSPLGVPALRYRFGGDCLFVMCKYGWAG